MLSHWCWAARELLAQINDSLSSTDDPVAATLLFIYRNKGDGYNWPSPPIELAIILPGCAQCVSLCSLWNSHIFLTFWNWKGETKNQLFKFFQLATVECRQGLTTFLQEKDSTGQKTYWKLLRIGIGWQWKRLRQPASTKSFQWAG